MAKLGLGAVVRRAEARVPAAAFNRRATKLSPEEHGFAALHVDEVACNNCNKKGADHDGQRLFV
jgi:hypothetical protein